MSSIRQRDSGIWYYHRYIDLPDERKRVHRSLRTKDEDKALQKKRRYDKYYDKKEREPNYETVEYSEAVEKFLKRRRRQEKAGEITDSTVRMERYATDVLGQYLEEEEDEPDIFVDQIDDLMLDDMRLWRSKDVSQSTVGANMTHLYSFFAYLKKRDWIQDNPMKEVKVPSTGTRKATDVPTKEEWKEIERQAEDFINRTDPKRLYVAFYLYVKFGFRLSEILRMTWERQPFQKKNNGSFSYIRGEGPSATAVIYSKRTEREVPIGKHWHAFKMLDNPTKWLFPSDRVDGHLRPNGYSRQISQLLSDLGYEKYSAHALRHGKISDLVRKDYSLKKIGELMGQRTTRITERYTHLTSEDLEDML